MSLIELLNELHTAPLALVNEAKLELLRDGSDVIDLSMINPDLPPPRMLLDKLLEASVRSDTHRYAVSRGIRKLRCAFGRKYEQSFGVGLDPDRDICVTMGSKDGVYQTLRCLLRPGAKALVGCPAYPVFTAALKILGCESRCFKISPDSQQMLQEIEESLAAEDFAVILLNFPNNPTGVAVDRSFYQELARIAAAADVFVINDFVYGELGFGAPGVSMLSATDLVCRAVEIYSLSKAYSIPGWRVAALMGAPKLVQAVAALKSFKDYGIFLPLQLAAAAALLSEQDLVMATRQQYQQRLQQLQTGLEQLGFKAWPPAAGCSLWVEMSPQFVYGSASDFCLELLRSTGVVVLPGTVFGPDYDRCFRVAAVAAPERLDTFLDRFEQFTREG